ncbi:DNA mismatch repair endonuclease MutL [Candidatus Zixiibacteriota bacterium]
MIQILPDGVINKIAAGEVVERPASVVKELVENALDAGARSVDIMVRSGGRDLIEIVDDGIGMSIDDARLALKRHATSKISSVEDLSTLDTFGFRGEALPSIASVSRFTLETSDGSSPEGVQIVIEGGRVTEEIPLARVRGTTIRVEHLFANVPARRKFLKSVQTEYRHIVKSVTEAALSRLDVGFTLRHDQREVFRLRGGRELRQRAAELFGSKALSGAVLLAAELDNMRLRGVLGAPAASRRTSGAVHLFVNGRPVNHRGLSYALFAGYGELLPHGRYPFACLFLEVFPSDVDVNVHPAKREVRFADEPRIKDFVITGVREALGRELGTRTFYRDRTQRGGMEGEGNGVTGVERRVSENDLPWHHTGLFTGLLPDARMLQVHSSTLLMQARYMIKPRLREPDRQEPVLTFRMIPLSGRFMTNISSPPFRAVSSLLINTPHMSESFMRRLSGI